jgi:phosphoglycerate-specific signal transduction histidine kinase
MDYVDPPRRYQSSCRIHGYCWHEIGSGCVFCSKRDETEGVIGMLLKQFETLRDQAETAEVASKLSTLMSIIDERTLLLDRVEGLQGELSEEKTRNQSVEDRYIAKNQELVEELRQLRPLKETLNELQDEQRDNRKLRAKLEHTEEDLVRMTDENHQLRQELAEAEKELVAVTGKLQSAQRLGSPERSTGLPRTKKNARGNSPAIRELARGGDPQDHNRNDTPD